MRKPRYIKTLKIYHTNVWYVKEKTRPALAAFRGGARRTVELLSAACVPVLLVILGLQLQGRGGRGPAAPLAPALLLRLAGGIAAALATAPLVGLEGVARQAGTLHAAMPSAVLCIILATKYDTEPHLVTAIVFLTTLLSPLTLTPLLVWLGA